jgi:hypothetical protein
MVVSTVVLGAVVSGLVTPTIVASTPLVVAVAVVPTLVAVVAGEVVEGHYQPVAVAQMPHRAIVVQMQHPIVLALLVA